MRRGRPTEGFDPAENGCCGIYAIAEATGLPFHTVFAGAAACLGKRSDWRGSLYSGELEKVLSALGVDYTFLPGISSPTNPYSVIELCWPGWILPTTRPAILHIPKHFLTLTRGILVDQNYRGIPTLSKHRFRVVDFAIAVTPVITNDSEEVSLI